MEYQTEFLRQENVHQVRNPANKPRSVFMDRKRINNNVGREMEIIDDGMGGLSHASEIQSPGGGNISSSPETCMGRLHIPLHRQRENNSLLEDGA